MSKKIAVSMGVMLLVVALVWSVGFSGAAEATAEEGERIIRVYGNAEISAEPDVARIVLGVETRSASASDAAAENARLMNAVVAALKKLGLKDEELKTGSYRINSYREPIKAVLPVEPREKTDENYVTFYRAVNDLRIALDDLKKTGTVIDAAVKAGANQVQSIQFDRKDPQNLQMEALKAATTQARTKAHAIAGSAGLTIKGIKSINEDTVWYAPYRASYDADELLAKKMEAAPTPVMPGEVTVQARVVAEFRF